MHEPEAAGPIPRGEITALLGRARGGDRSALDDLFARVYQDLRIEAHRRHFFRRSDDSMSTTALVHETYLKLVGAENVDWVDRRHFFAVSARAMRQILVDRARSRAAAKRGHGVEAKLLDTGIQHEEALGPLEIQSRAADLVALDTALQELSRADARLAELVELRFFVGLTVEETAEVLDLSSRTVKRDWRKARAFLHQALYGDEAAS